jgi:hypothetical protein
MLKVIELKEQIVRCRMAGIAIVLGATVAASAGAQQTETTGDSAGARTTPCPAPSVSSTAPSATAGVSGATTSGATTSGATAAGATASTSATSPSSGTYGTPTDAATTSGAAANPAPNNTSTNPDKRLTGLNATNGASGVGADTTTTGKRTPAVAERIPSDSVRAGATVCAPTKDHS